MAAPLQYSVEVVPPRVAQSPTRLERPAYLMAFPFCLSTTVANNPWMEELPSEHRAPNERRAILQSTGYVIKPDGTIAVAQYSSGPIGRLVWQDVLGLVQHYKKQAG